MTEPNSPDNKALETKNDKASATNTSSTKETLHSSTTKPDAKKQNNSQSTSMTHRKRSKTAVLALLISLAAAGSIATGYFWYQQTSQSQHIALEEKLLTANGEVSQQVEKLLNRQQNKFEQQLTDAIATIEETNKQRIAQLSAKIARLEQSSPQDWLIHEAEYLIRIASRTIWLEHDITAAINLLNDADARLKELNSPEFLPIRQQIKTDIAALKLMPSLTNEEAILTIMALEQQIAQLPLAMANIPEPVEAAENLALSSDTADWRENLAKTWQRFKQDFITVRRRNGQVEPLMSPNQQQNLRENLSLKLQQASWAARRENSYLYLSSLDQARSWLSNYFDMNSEKVSKFNKALQALSTEKIQFEYPDTLQSLTAIRKVIKQPSKPTVLQEVLPAVETTETPENKDDGAQ